MPALVQLHHPTSWPTPTMAFALNCIGLVLLVKTAIGLGKIPVADVHQALAMLAMLAAGVITWLMSCWLPPRRKTVHRPQSGDCASKQEDRENPSPLAWCSQNDCLETATMGCPTEVTLRLPQCRAGSLLCHAQPAPLRPGGEQSERYFPASHP